MTIFFTTKNTVIAFLAILLGILVAQSRVEAGVHSLREVVLGAVLAILLTSLVYWVMPQVRIWLMPRLPKHAENIDRHPSLAGRQAFRFKSFGGVTFIVHSQT